jgi:hypothetical protein
MWGDLSKLPNITATTINYGSTKFPTTAPTSAPGTVPPGTVPPGAVPPTASPTTAPTVPPIGTVGSSCGTGTPALVNGRDWAPTWVPYACTSPWNRVISANPTIASYSAQLNSVLFSSSAPGSFQAPLRSYEAGQYDYGHPIYYASTSDPLVNVHCAPGQYSGGGSNAQCDTADNGGVMAQIRLPAAARPAGGGDSHLGVIQPDGTEIDFWLVQRVTSNWTNGSTLNAGGGANCGNISTGTGWDSNNNGWSQTAASSCLAGGVVHAAELLAGRIDHALSFVGNCGSPSIPYAYPSGPGATTICPGVNGAPLGARGWYDVPSAVTNAVRTCTLANMAAPCFWPSDKAILNALHDRGGYFTDHGGTGVSIGGLLIQAESIQPGYSFFGAAVDPFAALVVQNWQPISGISGALGLRWVQGGPNVDSQGNWNPGKSGADFINHFHWLAPCSAQGMC